LALRLLAFPADLLPGFVASPLPSGRAERSPTATPATPESSSSAAALESGSGAPESPPRSLLSRRLLGQALLPAAWSFGAAVANADINSIIAESRREAKESAKIKSVWNWNYYKRPTGNYDIKDLQEFLPSVFKTRNQFEAILDCFDNPAVNLTDPTTHQLLREQNRIEPISKVRKESFRTRMWLRGQTKKLETAQNEYERIKRALDDEDAQLLLLSRTEDDAITTGAIKAAKRTIEDVVDALDDLIKLIPEDDQLAARSVADASKMEPLAVFNIDTLKKEKEIPNPATDDKKEEPAKTDPAPA